MSFVFDDVSSDDPVLDFGDSWCKWDGGAPSPAEVLETTGVDEHARTRVTIALAPNATHVAVARGRRLAVVATETISGKQIQSSSEEGAFFENTNNNMCVAEVRDAAGPDPGAYVTCVCWISFAVASGTGNGCGVQAVRTQTARNTNSETSTTDTSVAVGTSDGRLRIYALDGTLLITKRLDFGTPGQDIAPSPIRSMRVRDQRRSPSRDEVSEDLVATLDTMATRVDSVELRSALRRAHLMRASTQSQSRFQPTAEITIAEDAAHAPLTTTKWDLGRLAPCADALSVGRLPPSVARAGLARAEENDGAIGGVSTSSRGVGILVAGLGDPRGDSGTVALLASYDDDDQGLIDAAAALARKTATAAAATVSSLFGGAVSLATNVTKNLPVGRAVGGALVGVMEKAGNAAGNAAAEVLSLETGGDGSSNQGPNNMNDFETSKARPLTWRSAIIDPPRRTRRFAPAPRGPLVAAADGLGRVSVLDVAAPATLATARVIKGCRDAEMAWVEQPPPRGSNQRVVSITGGLGGMHLAIRSPKRNGGAVELWRVSGGVGISASAGASNSSMGKQSDDTADDTADERFHDCVRLLQATTPFGAAVAAATEAAATALAVAASKCYLLTPDGILREVVAP